MFKLIVRQPKTSTNVCLRLLVPLLVVFCVGFNHSPDSRAANRSLSQDVPLLELDKPIEREISGGQKQSYQLELREGQYAKIEIGSRRLRAGVTVFDPAGDTVTEYNFNQNSQVQQTIEAIWPDINGSFGAPLIKDALALALYCQTEYLFNL